MERTNERLEAVAEEDASRSTSSRGAKKVERIAQQSKGLIDDVKDWIDLKIELTELEIQEKLKARQGDAVAIAIIGFFGVIAVVFLLVALALGLGAWLGHPAWGFLMATGILSSVAGLLYALRFARGKRKTSEDQPDPMKLTTPSGQKKLEDPPDRKRLPAGASPSDALPETAPTGSTK